MPVITAAIVDVGANGQWRAAQGTITADNPAWNSTATWNSAGVTFTHLKANVTDTASAAASLLADLQVGGASQFKVSKAGVCTASTSFVATTLTGTLSTAAQPNVTSVGTLTSLTVSGTAQISGDATLRANSGTHIYNLNITTSTGVAASKWVHTLNAANPGAGDYAALWLANGAASPTQIAQFRGAGTVGLQLATGLLIDTGGLTVSAGTTAVQALTATGLTITGLSATAVSAGAADSAGAGFRLLRVPN